MDKSTAVARLERQRACIASLRINRGRDSEFTKWFRDTQVAIRNIFDDDSHLSDFSKISFSLAAYSSSTTDQDIHGAHIYGLDRAESILASLADEVRDYWPDVASVPSLDAIAQVLVMCNRFHLAARQLRRRYNERPAFKIADEYDVQDLMRALLALSFDDVRTEEWTPSYAGKSARMDFLIKDAQLVIETKKTRKGLVDKQVGDELMVDIQRYASHPDCKVLVCFVYDPDGLIANARGLERDLSGTHGGITVHVVIAPKGT